MHIEEAKNTIKSNKKLQRRSTAEQVSISPTFYEQLCHRKYFFHSFSVLTIFGFVTFWQKEISKKAAKNFLLKLTTGGILTLIAPLGKLGYLEAVGDLSKSMYYN